MTFNPLDHLIQIYRKNNKTGEIEAHDYLPVVYRIRWFRDVSVDGSIVTEMVEHDKDAKLAIFRATVDDRKGVATGYGSETGADWRDYVEKAETKAVGRALAMLGYGTAFTDEFDELPRIVDSPLAPPLPAENGLNGLKVRWKKTFRLEGRKDLVTRWDAYKINVLGHPVKDEGLDREHMSALLADIKLEESRIKP